MKSHISIGLFGLVLLLGAVTTSCQKKKVDIDINWNCPGSECAPWIEPVVTPCENLVINGSFEKTSKPGVCPNGYSQTRKCVGVSLPTQATADYFRCCNKGKVGIPENHFGTQYPFDGQAYIGGGISSSSKDYMEYIQLDLKQSLVVGQTYRVSFQVSLSDNSRNSFGPLGVAAVENRVSESDYNLASTVNPAVEFGALVTEKDCWEKMEGTFVADNPSRYIIIGVFRTIKDMDRIGTGSSLKNALFKCYFYYDDVRLECL